MQKREREGKKERERGRSRKIELRATHRDHLDKIKKVYSNNCELILNVYKKRYKRTSVTLKYYKSH